MIWKKIKILLILFLSFSFLGAQEQSFDLPKISLDTSKDLDSLVAYYRKKSLEYYFNANSSKALVYGLETRKIYDHLGDSSNLCWSYNLIGSIYQSQGKYKKSEEYLMRGYQLAYRINDTIEILRSINNLATAYAESKNEIKAFATFKEGLSWAKSIQHTRNIARFYYNLGTYYSTKDMPDSTLLYLDSALQFGRKLEDSNIVAHTYDLMAFVYLEKEEFNKSTHLNQRSIKIYAANKDTFNIVNLTNKLGRVYMRSKHFKYGERFLLEAIHLNKGKYISLESDSYTLLVEMYEKQQRWDKAFSALKKQKLIDDRFKSEKIESQWEMLELVESYERVKLQEEKASSERIQVAQKKELRNYLIILALAVLFIVVLILMFLKIKNANSLLDEQRLNIKSKNLQLAENLAEKNILLKEVHHRVKNNLQMVSSLLAMQGMAVEDESLRKVFDEGQSRIESMALIHQQLYQTEHLSALDCEAYIEDLIGNLQQIHPVADSVDFQLEIEKKINVSIDTIIPIGLMINEIISNSLKYAFVGDEKGVLKVRFVQYEQNSYILSIKDNGVGYPEDFNIETAKSLGMRLIHIFSNQIGGELRCYNENGAVVDFRFKI